MKIMNDFLHSFSAKNTVKESTCFKKVENPSNADLIITNTPNSILTSLFINTGISDCHEMVVSIFKQHIPKVRPETVLYTKYKHFDSIYIQFSSPLAYESICMSKLCPI